MKVDILGVQIDRIGFEETVRRIESFLTDGRPHLVTTPYAESVVAAQADPEFRTIINESDLAVPDGGGLLAAAEFLSCSLPVNLVLKISTALFYGLGVGVRLALAPQTFRIIKERVSGADLVWALSKLSFAKGYKIFLLGGGRGVAAGVAGKLRTFFPGLRVESHPGPEELAKSGPEEISDIINYINRFSPDFLFVAFKPVVQEKWLVRNRGEIKAKVLMAVGGAFDMITGVTPRAPQLLRRLNLEWLWRLILEPHRLKRIYTAVIVFPWLVFIKKTS